MKPLNARKQAFFDILQWLKDGKAFYNNEQKFSKKSDYQLYILILKNVFRHFLKYEFFIKNLIKKKRKIDSELKAALLLSLAQTEADQKIPTHSIVDESVKIIKLTKKKFLSPVLNGALRNYFRQQEELSISLSKQPFSIQHSVPPWLWKKWSLQFEIHTLKNIAISNSQPPLFHFFAKDGDSEAINKGQILDVIKNQFPPNSYSTENIETVLNSKWFKRGDIVVQDLSSQILCKLIVELTPSSFLDICSAPGGKLTNLVANAKNLNIAIGADFSFNRIKRVQENLNRLKIDAKTLVMDGLRPSIKGKFDIVLLDAPCSGTGVIKKHPEIKWQRTEEDIKNNHEKQKLMLEEASKLVKKGGYLIYSTCSIEKEENQEVIDNFLKIEEFGKKFSRTSIRSILSSVHLNSYISEKGDLSVLPTSKTTGLFACFMEKLND